VTYKVGTTFDIPVTNGLIKGSGVSKHPPLKEANKFLDESTCSFKSQTSLSDGSIDSASKLETEPNE
jgi:hypothetical protein